MSIYKLQACVPLLDESQSGKIFKAILDQTCKKKSIIKKQDISPLTKHTVQSALKKYVNVKYLIFSILVISSKYPCHFNKTQ